MEKMQLELYHAPETRSMRVAWMAHELSIESQLTVKKVDLAKGEHYTEEYKALNPMSAVPLLVVTDAKGKRSTVTESSAIVLLLADECGALQPPVHATLARAQYYRAAVFAATAIDPLIEAVRWNEVYAPESKRDLDAARRAREQFKAKPLPLLRTIFKDASVTWACAPHYNHFTAADVALGFSLMLAKLSGMLDEDPLIAAYADRCEKRAAWKKAVAI